MRAYLSYVFLFIYLPVSAQITDLFPENYTTYFNNTAIINPGFIPLESKGEFFSMYRQRIGQFHKIANYSLTCSKTFRKENNAAHLARVYFSNEKEGPYIDKPRAYVNYAYEVPLAEETAMSAGLSAGFTQIYISAPSATASGNATMPDGGFGLMFRRRKFQTGISSLQIFNASADPIKASIKLRRYYNFLCSQDLEINPVLKLRGNFLYQMVPQNQNRINVALEGIYNDLFSIGGAFRNREGIAVFGSLQAGLGEDQVFISFAYNTGLFSYLKYGFNSIELNFAYKFH